MYLRTANAQTKLTHLWVGDLRLSWQMQSPANGLVCLAGRWAQLQSVPDTQPREPVLRADSRPVFFVRIFSWSVFKLGRRGNCSPERPRSSLAFSYLHFLRLELSCALPICHCAWGIGPLHCGLSPGPFPFAGRAIYLRFVWRHGRPRAWQGLVAQIRWGWVVGRDCARPGLSRPGHEQPSRSDRVGLAVGWLGLLGRYHSQARFEKFYFTCL